MNKLAIAVTLTVGVLGLSACADNSGAKDIVVETIAGDITKNEFYQKLKDQYGDVVLRGMVTTEVLDDKYEVSKEEIDKEVKKTKDQLGEQFELALQQMGIKDEDAYRELVRKNLLLEQAIYEDVNVTEDEIKEQYDRMKTEVQAQHILVDDKKTAKEIKNKLNNGKNFAQLAKEYSKDKSNASKGGKLGYFSVGEMAPAFEDAVFSMKKGEISDPVQTQFGYHIIKVTDKREKEKDIGEYKDMKDDIRRQIRNEKVDPEKAQSKIQGLLDEAKIDVKDDQFKDLFGTEGNKEENNEK
ncbi:peptidylprolyl isomerase [Virgibacillus ihumii]|uniref:peptidylprolyl isomerase n=1 Tax=Virgibacillus ihumii TaxID=2686091 RepID=UPI00157D13E2|nr:peptidylprolyl isomerase [Virgibacillus ihumii]